MTVEEIREALADWDEWSRLWCEEPDKTLTRKPPEWGRIVEAARAYAEWLEQGRTLEAIDREFSAWHLHLPYELRGPGRYLVVRLEEE